MERAGAKTLSLGVGRGTSGGGGGTRLCGIDPQQDERKLLDEAKNEIRISRTANSWSIGRYWSYESLAIAMKQRVRDSEAGGQDLFL